LLGIIQSYVPPAPNEHQEGSIGEYESRSGRHEHCLPSPSAQGRLFRYCRIQDEREIAEWMNGHDPGDAIEIARRYVEPASVKHELVPRRRSRHCLASAFYRIRVANQNNSVAPDKEESLATGEVDRRVDILEVLERDCSDDETQERAVVCDNTSSKKYHPFLDATVLRRGADI